MALLALVLFGTPRNWEYRWYDRQLLALQRFRPPVSGLIAHLDVGEADLLKYKTTRQEYDGLARLISRTREQGAAVILVDLLLYQGEDADFRAFWAALQDDVVLASMRDRPEGTRVPPDCQAARALIDMCVDPDGTMRRYKTGGPGGPSLALAAYLKLHGQEWRADMVQNSTLVLEDTTDTGEAVRRLVPSTFLFDQRAGWSDQSPRNFFHFTPTQLEEWSHDPNSAKLEGKAVFIAYVAPGNADIGATPLDPACPRVAVHAWALNDLILGSWRQFLSGPSQAGLGLLLLALAFVASPLRGRFMLLVWLGGSVALWGGSAAALLTTHEVAPTGSLWLVWTAALVLESYRRRKLRESRELSVKATDDPLVGRTVGTFVLAELLGQGGFATVYRGLDKVTLDPGSVVAIKVIHPAQAQNPEFCRRFLREVRISSSLEHPAIVRVLASGEQDGLLYLTMELLTGRPLRYFLELEKGRPWSLPEALSVLQSLLQGMIHAHSLAVLHRDLKPENLMVVLTEEPSEKPWRFSQIKIVDFGLAFDSESTQLTKSGEVFGTLDYLAPERIQGIQDDPRSDQYAVGVMAYEMLAGTSPFPKLSVSEMLLLRLTGTPPSLRESRPDLPHELIQVVDRMLSREREERFATLTEVLAVLSGL